MRTSQFELKQFLGIFTIITGLVGLLGSSSLQAADCKGLAKAKCEGSDACTWVSAYKTKTGKTVDAYCRAKPKAGNKAKKSGGGTQVSSAKKSGDSKTDKKKSTSSHTSSDKKKTDVKSANKEKSDKKKSDKKKSNSEQKKKDTK